MQHLNRLIVEAADGIITADPDPVAVLFETLVPDEMRHK